MKLKLKMKIKIIAQCKKISKKESLRKRLEKIKKKEDFWTNSLFKIWKMKIS